MKRNKKVVWCVVDVKNIGVDRESPALFADIEGRYHIFKTRKEAREYINNQFFPARDMGWRAVKYRVAPLKDKAGV